MNWKETFYTGKREHPQEKKPASLTALLMPSLLGVAICLVCLCSLTWAWFTATQNSGVQPIQSATATVTASLNDTATSAWVSPSRFRAASSRFPMVIISNNSIILPLLDHI